MRREISPRSSSARTSLVILDHLIFSTSASTPWRIPGFSDRASRTVNSEILISLWPNTVKKRSKAASWAMRSTKPPEFSSAPSETSAFPARRSTSSSSSLRTAINRFSRVLWYCTSVHREHDCCAKVSKTNSPQPGQNIRLPQGRLVAPLPAWCCRNFLPASLRVQGSPAPAIAVVQYSPQLNYSEINNLASSGKATNSWARSGTSGAVSGMRQYTQMDSLRRADAKRHPARKSGPAGAQVAVGPVEGGVGVGLYGHHMAAQRFKAVQQGAGAAGLLGASGWRLSKFVACSPQECCQSPPVVAPQAAGEEIETLHAGCAFIKRHDASIAQILLQRPVLDIARPTQHLDGGMGGIEAGFRAKGLDQRQHPGGKVGLAGIGFQTGQIHDRCQLQHGGAQDFGSGPDIVQLAPHIGMAGDRWRRLVRAPALPALAGIVLGDVGGGRGDAQSLNPGMQPHWFDHGEELGQASSLFAQQDALCLAEAHGTGGRAMQSELFLDALKGDAIGRAINMVGYQEQAETTGAGLVIGTGEHAVANAAGHVMVAKGNPDLLAGNQPGTIAQLGLGANPADVGAGLGLGNADGGGPFTRYQLGSPLGRRGGIGRRGQQVDGTPAGAGGHHQRHAAAIKQRTTGRLQGEGNVQPTKIDRRIDAEPAGFGILAETVDKARRQLDAPVRYLGADAITHRIERRQHGFGKAGSGVEHGRHDVIVAIGSQRLHAGPARCQREHGEGAAGLVGEAHFGCIRMAPSSRMTSPLIYWFSMTKRTASANSAGSPSRDG